MSILVLLNNLFEYFLQKIQLTDTVLIACVVGSTVWLCKKRGDIQVYCSITYKPLALAHPSGSRSIISILHSLACNCVVVGSIDGSIMSYHDHISSYTHNVSQQTVEKYFGKLEYNEPIKELIHNRVFTDSMFSNPIICLAAVPSRAKCSRMEDSVTYYGSAGEPIACSSRAHTLDVPEEEAADHVHFELWCGLERGLITILDLQDLEKV